MEPVPIITPQKKTDSTFQFAAWTLCLVLFGGVGAYFVWIGIEGSLKAGDPNSGLDGLIWIIGFVLAGAVAVPFSMMVARKRAAYVPLVLGTLGWAWLNYPQVAKMSSLTEFFYTIGIPIIGLVTIISYLFVPKRS